MFCLAGEITSSQVVRGVLVAWIESHTVLPRHRKVLLLAHDLKTDIVQTIGHLHCLWYTVLEQQENGDLSDWPDTLISQAALWKGDATEFVTRLREREWLDGHLVHDWIDYVGPYLTKKYSSGNVPRLKEIWLLHGFKYGKGQGKYAKQKASVKRAESERKVRIPFPSLPNPSSPLPSLPDLTLPSLSESKAPGGLESFMMTPELETWSAKEGIHNPSQYIEEFKDHWKTTGGKKKNGQIVKDWPAAFRNRLRFLKENKLLKVAPRVLPHVSVPKGEYVPPPKEVEEMLKRVGVKIPNMRGG